MTDILDPAAVRFARLEADDALAELVAIEVGCIPEIDYSHDPNGWLEATTGEYAWSTQRAIWQSVADNRATAVLSCNNSGKTWLAARIVVWFVMTHWRAGVRVVTTAPTAAQVSLLLWQEIRAAYNRAKEAGAKVPGRIIGSPYPQWKIGDVTAGFGRKPADHEQSAMQGVHARHVLAVVDEAGGVGQNIYDALDKITTNEGARILLIGNPDNRAAPFGRITQPGSGFHVIRVDGLRTPNFTREEVESGRYPMLKAHMRHEGIPYATERVPDAIRPHLLSPLWVEERYTRWCGIQPEVADRLDERALGQLVSDAAGQSQLFTAAVRGDFPDVAGDSVLPLSWVQAAMNRWRDWAEGAPALRGNRELGLPARPAIPGKLEPRGRRILGVDVATTNGADETVIAPRAGDVVFAVHRYPEGDSHTTAERVIRHAGGNLLGALAVVDVIGIGMGVRDVLVNQHHLSVVSFVASEQSDRTDRHGEFWFLNDRAAAWWRVRELLDPTYGSTLCLPPDDRLLEELTAPKWSVRTGTKPRIQIESKDEIRKRLGHSTDSADAVIQSLWVDGPMPKLGGTGAGAIGSGSRPQAQTRSGGAGAIAYRLGDGEE